MKHFFPILLMGLALLPPGSLQAWPKMQPAMIFQGSLSSNGVPATGPHELVFSIYDAPSGGNLLARRLTNSAVLSDGRFEALLDGWEPEQLGASNLFLEIAVLPAGADAHQTLSPRQRLFEMPRAAVSGLALKVDDGAVGAASLVSNAVTTAALANGAVTADKLGAGAAVKSLNGFRDNVALVAGPGVALSNNAGSIIISIPPSFFPGCETNCFWRLGGNPSTTAGQNFVGTTDNQGLWFKVNSTHAERFEVPTGGAAGNVPNRIGGAQANTITPGEGGSAILAGGSANQPNRIVTAAWSILGGGDGNLINNHYSALLGGRGNIVGSQPSGTYSLIGGGHENRALGYTTVIGGGRWNHVDFGASYGAIVAGLSNHVAGAYGAIGGGVTNYITTNVPYAAIPGGMAAQALSYGQFAHANGQFGENGDAQASEYILRRTVPVAMGVPLYLDGDAATRSIMVPRNSSWTFEILFVARAEPGFSISPTVSLKICGALESDGNGNVTILNPITTTIKPGPITVTVPSNSNSQLNVIVNNNSGDIRYRCVATLETAQLNYYP